MGICFPRSRAGLGTDVCVGAALLALGAFHLATVLRVEAYLPDSSVYIGLARNIVEQRAYVFNYRPHTIYPPGFPLILAGLGAITGRVDYETLMRFMPLVGTAALGVWYLVLRRLTKPTVAALCCLLVATSLPYYQLTTQYVMSDLPFFLASGLVIWSWLALSDREASASRSTAGIEPARPIGMVSLCVLTITAVAIRTVGVAICAGMLAWAVAATQHWIPLRRSKRNAALAASLAGLLAFGLWLAWSRAHTAPEDHLNHMRTYASQFGMKDPHRPELGPATSGDLARRVVSNMPAQTTAVVTPFARLAWINPLWYSPLVVIPLLLLATGVMSGVLDERTAAPAWYFAAYFFVYLLWPFDERVRFMLPVAPLAAFLAWRGTFVVRSLARTNPISAAWSAAIVSTVIAATAGLSGIVGLQARLSIAFWAGVLFASAIRLVSKDRTDHIAATVLQRPRARYIAGVGALTLLLAAGAFQQLVAARANLAPNPATFVQDPAVRASSWLRTAPDGIVMAQQSDIIHRLTGRKIQPFPVASDARAIVEDALEAGVRYVVVSRPIKDEYFFPTEEQRLEAIDRAFPGLLRFVHEDRSYRVFEIRRRAQATSSR